MAGGVLEHWLEEVLTAPGATGLRSVDAARRVLLDDAQRAAPFVASTEGPVIDVGSGGGSPGIPLAATLPHRHFTLLEAERRKCVFLERFAAELPNVDVVWGRAEEQPADLYGVALAKALARPPTAVELCLPLVRPGGAVVLWLGPSAERGAVATVAALINGTVESDAGGLVVIRKLAPTPAGFPRRSGMAKRRPLA